MGRPTFAISSPRIHQKQSQVRNSKFSWRGMSPAAGANARFNHILEPPLQNSRSTTVQRYVSLAIFTVLYSKQRLLCTTLLLPFLQFVDIINPWRVCTTGVTIVVKCVCVSVCVCPRFFYSALSRFYVSNERYQQLQHGK